MDRLPRSVEVTEVIPEPVPVAEDLRLCRLPASIDQCDGEAGIRGSRAGQRGGEKLVLKIAGPSEDFRVGQEGDRRAGVFCLLKGDRFRAGMTTRDLLLPAPPVPPYLHDET